jgi:predicted glycosyl hydrolase (DUF1957 family)
VKIGILLHFYQPYIQKEAVFRKIADECYIPLLKLFKSYKNHTFTLDVPLSFIELMSKYGYESWISDLKSLVVSERVELVGSAAYHPLLTKITDSLVEKQIYLNEFSLGYYFGLHQGFEGEPGVMIKNIKGFFPPELAVNDSVIRKISDLGYEWVICENFVVSSLENSTGSVFTHSFMLPNLPIKLIVRDKDLSNMLAFKRDATYSDAVSYLGSYETNAENGYIGVISLDAETFGHHNKDGIHVLSSLLDYLGKMNVSVMQVSSIIPNMDALNVKSIYESSWGQQVSSETDSDIYPLWCPVDNKVNSIIWKINKNLQIISDKITDRHINSLDMSESLENISDMLRNDLGIHSMKLLLSDISWWSSKYSLPDGTLLYDREFINTFLTDVSVFVSNNSENIDAEVRNNINYDVNEVRSNI